ncbi:unnamed protein product [Paramecium sonneborni]|uniref:Uncharacterized protein n=1 Tax=Paramecium sonneborni TaxID=65129 RepID=A0A8S1RUW5_9CILI|nr:unnamed protein product [Paramecium sonneborni]
MVENKKYGISFMMKKECILLHTFIYNFRGGGEFDVNGLKDDYWIELSDYFQFQHQITFNGIYKSGNQNIMLRMYKDRPFYQIGGGFFGSNGKKKGSWMDFGIEFSNLTQKAYTGKYKDDKKYGKWEIIYQKKNWWWIL